MKSKQSVVFFTHYNTMNGANQSLLTLISYLRDDIEVKKVVVYGKGEENNGLMEELRQIGIPCQMMPLRTYLYFSGFMSFLSLPVNLMRNLSVWKSLYNELKNEKIDWIYSNSSVENSGIVMARMLNVKHIWHIREFGYRDYKYFHLGGGFTKRKFFAQSTKLIANSKSIASYIGLPDKTVLVYNGIFSMRELDSIEEKKFPPSVKKLGMVGIISETKNQERAVDLVHRLKKDANKHVPLNIYGGVVKNSYFQQLKTSVENLGISDLVTFHGFVADRSEIYGNIDILLMCSKNEAFGRVTIEAMAYGIPVIGFDNAGTQELIENGVNGFLYDQENISIEEPVIRLLEDEELYQQVSENAQNAASDYSVEEYGGRILRVLTGSVD